MFYLLATIFLNTVLFVLFRLFPKYRIDGLQAIVVNYFVCVATGSIFLGTFPIAASSVRQPWFPWAAGMSVLLFSLFNLLAWRTKEDGITTTTTANKLSLVIPVLISVLFFKEGFEWMKLAGITLAFPAVYLTTGTEEKEKLKSILFPALIFFSSGALDALMVYMQKVFLKGPESQAVFTIHLFALEAAAGSLVILVLLLRNKIPIQGRNVFAGIVLGVPNYFSIYCLIRLLEDDFLQSSADIPVNNIGIVLSSALIAVLIFGEKMSKKRLAGLALSVLAILLIACSEDIRSIFLF